MATDIAHIEAHHLRCKVEAIAAVMAEERHYWNINLHLSFEMVEQLAPATKAERRPETMVNLGTEDAPEWHRQVTAIIRCGQYGEIWLMGHSLASCEELAQHEPATCTKPCPGGGDGCNPCPREPPVSCARCPQDALMIRDGECLCGDCSVEDSKLAPTVCEAIHNS